MADIRMSPMAIIVAAALARGLPIEQLTAATGLTLTDLFRPDLRLSHETTDRLWRCLAEALPDTPLGLDVVEQAPFDFFGPLLHVASYAETLRDALAAFVRYRRLLSSDLHLALREAPRRSALLMSHPLDADGPSPGPEIALGIGCRFVREVLGVDDAVLAVDLQHGPNGPEDRYVQVFGVPVHFGRPANCVWFATAALDRPTAQGDAHRYEHLVAHVDLLHRDLVAAGHADGLNPIRAAIAHNARRGEFGADAVARHLGTSLRSLQRAVQAEGTTLKALLDDSRERHARRLLADPGLSTDEVAFLLGYASESAFRRAFRRWTGQSPAEARRAALP